jgi:hypothetical protein
MNDHELAQRFIKIEPAAGSINVLVCKIGWSDSHTPIFTWELTAKLNADVSSTKVDTQIHKALNNKQYFQVCKECGERKPCGWMHRKSICQSCAERNHGIVH